MEPNAALVKFIPNLDIGCFAFAAHWLGYSWSYLTGSWPFAGSQQQQQMSQTQNEKQMDVQVERQVTDLDRLLAFGKEDSHFVGAP